VYLRDLYLIKNQCLLDDFGLASKGPWEPELTLVLCITQILMGRLNEKNKSWKTCCTCK
jgi:hypothetical protein